MTVSSGTRRLPTGTNRLRPSGTLTRAKRSSPLSGSDAITPSESDRPETYGNGWPGPTARGVRIGKISRSKYRPSFSCSRSEHSSIVAISMPASVSAGRSSRFHRRPCRAISSPTRTRIASSACSETSPSTERLGTSDSASSSRPATRTMKNSSRFLAKIAANLTRSSSGNPSSSASSRTRALNSTHESSRLISRDGVGSVMVATD